MSLPDFKQYLIGAVNVLIVAGLAGLLGVLLILQIKAYGLNVSYSFSWKFFVYDPFATMLLIIVLAAIAINLVSAVIMMAGMFSHTLQTNAIMFSMSSIMWIIIFLTADHAFQNLAFTPVVILMCTLIILFGIPTKKVTNEDHPYFDNSSHINRSSS